MYETELTVVGTLITGIGRRRLPDGTPVVSFRVASNERRFDRAGDAWTDGDTLYVSVTAWRRLAENVHASFVSGDPIIVRGRLFSRSYEKDGRRNWVTEMEATAVGPDLTRSTAAVTRTKRNDGPGTDSATDADGEVGGSSGSQVEQDDPWASALRQAEHGESGVPDEPARREAVEAAVGT